MYACIHSCSTCMHAFLQYMHACILAVHACMHSCSICMHAFLQYMHACILAVYACMHSCSICMHAFLQYMHACIPALSICTCFYNTTVYSLYTILQTELMGFSECIQSTNISYMYREDYSYHETIWAGNAWSIYID